MKLKSFSSNPELFPLSEREHRAFQTLLLPFVTGSAADQKDWAGIGLGDTSYSVRAKILFSFIQHHRNWVASFSIDGLKALLSEGIILGSDEYEKNWCALQSAPILLSEKEENRNLMAVHPEGRRVTFIKLLFFSNTSTYFKPIFSKGNYIIFEIRPGEHRS